MTLSRRPGLSRNAIAALAISLAGMLLLLDLAPESAQAKGILGTGISIPNPITLLGNGIGSLLGGIGGGIAQIAVDAFDAIIKHLFAPIAKFVNTQLIGWLISVPNFTQGHVQDLERTVCAMGAAMLGAVATVSIARFWASGFAGGGTAGHAALDGLARTMGAALFLPIWPWIFTLGVNLANAASTGLMGSGTVTNDTAHLLAAGLGAGVALSFAPIGLFLDLVMAIAASLLFFGLLLMKVVVSLSTILVFVGMPAAVVLWPAVPWIARLLGRAFGVCLMVPFVWALCFAASGAVSMNVLSFNGGGGVLDKLLQPLVAIVLLWITLILPRTLARVAMLGGSALGGGFVSRAASYAAGAELRQVIANHVPGSHGSRGGAPKAREDFAASVGSSKPALAAAATVAGGAAAGAAAAGVGGAKGATTSDAVQHIAAASSGGLQTPSFRPQEFADEMQRATERGRTSPVSASQAGQALGTLSDPARRGVAELEHRHGAGAREQLAYQALGQWSGEEREAIRTLAAATPEVRSQALADVGLLHTDAAGSASPPASPVGGGGPTAPVAPADESPIRRAPGGSAAPSPSPPVEPTETNGQGNGKTQDASDGLGGTGAPPPREPRGPDPDQLFRD